MEKEKLGQEPAFGFGFKEEIPTPWSSLHSTQIVLKRHEGMSKRFYAACAAMQGMLAHSTRYHCRKEDEALTWKQGMIKEAYELADELLKQEKL